MKLERAFFTTVAMWLDYRWTLCHWDQAPVDWHRLAAVVGEMDCDAELYRIVKEMKCAAPIVIPTSTQK